MLIIPAVDLIESKIVRLYQGDFSQKTQYEGSALDLLRSYVDSGAKRLHVVDLQGSKNPQERQWKEIQKLVSSLSCPVQMGGGIRSFSDAEGLYKSGLDQVIVGTMALKDPAETQKVLSHYPQTILASDLRVANGNLYIASHGWTKNSGVRLQEFLEQYPDLRFSLCTDIAKDGTLSSPSFALYERLQTEYPQIKWIASGGVSNLEDLKRLKRTGVYGVVIGKALLEGKFRLEEALLC